MLAERCYQCHSAEAAGTGMLMGKLQLDTREGVERGGARGSIVVPGRPDQSMLIDALDYTDPNLQMPPGGKLPDQVIADFVKWVALGAPDPRDAKAIDTAKMDLESGRRHWAFRPLRPVDPPQVSAAGPDEAAWRDSPIDRFVLGTLHEKQFRPAQEADRPTLIRRAYFDLIGLPPAPDEVEAFVRDSSAEPFRQLVDRLLASLHYGERWGRHWLDVARFGESLGAHEGDNALREDAYRYRDAVIRAFNDDLPYDEFVRDQVAGAPKVSRRPAGSGHVRSHWDEPERERQPERSQVSPPRRHGVGDRSGVPCPHGRVCALPRPQDRPDHGRRVLSVDGCILRTKPRSSRTQAASTSPWR